PPKRSSRKSGRPSPKRRTSKPGSRQFAQASQTEAPAGSCPGGFVRKRGRINPMLGTGWLTLRQIRAALQNGRLEEAQQLLNQPAVRGHKKSWDLLTQLTRGYVQRGERLLQQANSTAAWDDLGKAEALAPADTGARKLREGLIHHGVAEVRGLLESGEPRRALETVARLGQRGVQQPEFQN